MSQSMKLTILISLLLPAIASATDVPSKLTCESKARDYMQLIDTKVAAEVDRGQELTQQVVVETSSESSGEENSSLQIYHYYVTAQNKDGAYWDYEYEIIMRAQLENASDVSCQLEKLDYIGLVDWGKN